MTTDTAPAPAPAAPPLLERVKADLRAALHDAGHPLWAADALVHHIEAVIEAKLEAIKQEIKHVIP